jgi:surfeit locus 1 family protein
MLGVFPAPYERKRRRYEACDDGGEQQQNDESQAPAPEAGSRTHSSVDTVTPRFRGTAPGEQIAAAGLLVLAACFFGLALWQWDRAGTAREVHENHASAGRLPALTALPQPGQLRALRDRDIELGGRYRPGTQFLLDNMTHQGTAGFHVLTPFELSDGGAWVLVNRGWVRGHPDRRVLPDAGVADHDRRLRGRIGALPEPGLRLAAPPAAGVRQPLEIVSFPTLEELEHRLERPLLGFVILLADDQDDGYLRAWQPSALPPERHLGYAFQWLALALLAAGTGSVVVIRSFRERRQ